MSDPRPGTRLSIVRTGVRLGVSAVVAAVSIALVTPVASGETLSDLRARLQAAQSQQTNAQANVASAQQNVASATDQLLKSQTELGNAQAVLADVQVQLSAAKEAHARLVEELSAARAALAAAAEEVLRGEAEVATQRRLIVDAVRDSFQRNNDLVGLSVVFEAESTAELSQRLQWNTTIFDSQAAQKSRLDAALVSLEQARDAQAEIESQVAAAEARAAESVTRMAQLERQASAQQAAVAALVGANAQARAAAQQELDADESHYRTLQSDEDRLRGEIQAEIARLRAEEEAARRAAAAQAAAAAKAAAAKAAASKPSAPAAATAPKAATSATSTASGPKVSKYGFIRPVSAAYGSAFGLRYHPILHYWRAHNGVDMGAATGTPIYAAADGVVMKAGVNGGFGNFVLLGHGSLINGKYVTTGYAHQSRIAVRVGQSVKRGQLIGYVGSTGLSTAPHLHFELRLDGVPVNPVLYVP